MNNFDKNLGKNPTLISLDDLNSLSSTNIVGIDSFKRIFETTKFSFSAQLLNYSEPEIFKGIERSVFYSDINTEFNKGDKVFIINGNYDSNAYIETNKYDLDSDGYEILDIDNCRIVLDIKYDSTKLPYTEVSENKVINIYPVDNTSELESVTSILSEGDVKKFDISQKNAIYYNDELNYDISNIFDPLYTGPTYSGATYSGPTQSGINNIFNFSWINMNDNFKSGDGKFFEKKIRIVGKNFEFDGVQYKKGFVYKFENGKWIPSIENMVPIITKTNFRGGKMMGSWNSGVYGVTNKTLEWDNPEAKWGGGFLYNANWNLGEINSLDTGIDSYICKLENGVPLEESIEPNNNGFGYNYILSSNIKGGVVNNGNIINSIVDNNLTDNIVKDYIEGTLSTTASNFIEINGGLFLESYIEDSVLSGSRLDNSRVKNITFNNGLSVNSYFESSVFNNSTYLTDDIIRILGIETNDTNSGVKGYKFKISEESYNRLELGDYFFIKGLIFLNDPKPINFFHKKFKLSSFTERFEYVDGVNLEYVDLKITCYLTDDLGEYFVNILFETDSNITFPNIENLDSSSSYILDSNFESGLFESSDWNSGFNINDSVDNISNLNGDGKYNLKIQSGDKLKVVNNINLENDEIVFLGSIEHTDDLDKFNPLNDTYIVVNSTSRLLSEFSTDPLLPSLGTTDFFGTGNLLNRNGYLHRLKFKDSNIKGGIFVKSYFNKCLIENPSYKSSDKDFKDLRNIRSLLISESIFSRTNNFLSSATYLNCLFNKKQDVLIDGIVYKSIWDGGEFTQGIFRESTWIDGVFNGGEFYKNSTFDRELTTSTKPDYTYNQIINSLYKSGDFPNDRYSWQKGTFNGGRFNKSDWERGDFNNGKFVNSNFYSGNIKGGVFGDKSVEYNNTRVYSGVISNVKVENAELFTEDVSFSGTTNRTIEWKNGVFESGVFGSKNITKEVCYEVGGVFVDKSEGVDYIFISNFNDSFRLDIENTNNNEINLTYNQTSKSDLEYSIKSISDSFGNLIELQKSSVIGEFGKIIKYSKNGGVIGIGITDWIIEADDELRDIHIDNFDNLYICYKTKIEKWTFDKKLIWSISNNNNNLSISGDDEFIYIGGIDGNGYIEKWTINGEFDWRSDLTEITTTTEFNQKIINFGNTILINGSNIIYKINKLNGIVDDNSVGVGDINDYTYDVQEESIIITLSDRFKILDIDNISISIEKEYAGIGAGLSNDSCSHIEYYNGFVYVKNYDPNFITETRIYKLEFNGTSFSIEDDLIVDNISQLSDDVLYNKFTVRNNGIKYSKLELISPTHSNGVLVDGVNTFDISNTEEVNLGIDGVEFEVDRISFNYSVSDLGYYGTTQSLPDLTFAVYQNNIQITSTQSISTNEYSIVDDGGTTKYIYATDWNTYEETLTGTHNVGDNYFVRISGITYSIVGQYEVKIDNLCLHSKDGAMLAIWKDGRFNGGEFIENAQWENGSFNGGLFLSTYGDELITSTQSPTQSINFAWQNGKFNGGEFGNGLIENNSNWFNGEFNGGVFKGKLWNDGIFTNGKFEGGIDVNILTTSNTQDYLSTVFNNLNEIDYKSTKGVWRNGYVTTKKDRFIKDKKLFTDLKKSDNENSVVSFENVLWAGGTFSHDQGTMDNSIWLDGTFESGTFRNSVFNPWRHYNEFNLNDSCIWEGGLFKGGDFYYSNWNGGLFDTGNAYGMIWNGGVSNYMNAYNILWKSGTWKNGNWFGSNFDYIGSSSVNDFETAIMGRVNEEYHIWNVFNDKVLSPGISFTGTASNDII